MREHNEFHRTASGSGNSAASCPGQPQPLARPGTAKCDRRQALQLGGLWAAAACGCAWPEALAAQSTSLGRRPRVAAINSIYRFRSHAYHIAGRFIHGYRREGQMHHPPCELVRMYNDQYPENDLSRSLCRERGIELCSTVADALGGAQGLDVDAVLLICEHGDYPLNERGQILYPRFELFQEIVEVFQKSGRSVPVFNDKHLSYDYRKARQMVETSRRMGFGLMAGSSLPATWRRPELELPLESPITEALTVYGGSIEVYFFHGLETLQCMVERRRGGETGIRTVRMLHGPAVWQAGDQGLWSRELLEACLSRSPSRNIDTPEKTTPDPHLILIEYLDGTRGAVLNLPEHVSDFTFACRLQNQPQPVSCSFELPAPPGARYFDCLVGNIEKFFAAGKPPYPVERTLLTSTVLDWAMRSLAEQGRALTDESLAVRYQAPADGGFVRGRFTDA